MTTPVITDFPLPFPAKGQSDTDFNNNVDAYLSWLSGTNVSELQIALPWVQARLEEVAATALSGTLPDISAQSGKSLIVNYLGTAVAFAPLAGRNLIINGSGRINQRGYVSAAATIAANQFTLDRWFVVTSGQNMTFVGNDAGRTMTAPAGGVSQVIEGANIVGGTYVINWAGTATCTVDGVARLKGATFTLTANTNAKLIFSSGTYTDVQIELGTVSTAFEREDASITLLRSQRYYWRGLPTQALNFPSYASGVIMSFTVTWPVTMRAAPTVGATVPGIVTAICSLTSVDSATVHGARVIFTSSGISTNANVSFVSTDYFEATSELTA